MMNNNEKIKKEADSFRKWKKRRKTTILLIVILSVILSIVLSVAVGYSWLVSSNSAAKRELKVTNFSAVAVYSLDGSDPDTKLDNKLITKANFAKFRLSINYSGESNAYLRVKLTEIFRNKNGDALIVSDVNYNISTDWVYDSGSGYYYYKDVASGTETIPFITGGVTIPTEKYAYANTDGFILKPIIETVQPDRFEEFFTGVDPTELGIN